MSYGISGEVFAFISSFSLRDGFECFWMGNLLGNIQLIVVFFKAPSLVLQFPYSTLMTFLMTLLITLLSTLMILLSILSLTRHSWQQLDLAAELESDLKDTVDWGKKWLVDLNAGKIQLVSFDRSNNTGATDMKKDGSVLEKNNLLRC